MKKDLKSKSKRKWIVGGVLLFGGVALLTTGFATWAIGVNQTKQNLGTNVSVQGTVNESVKLTVTSVSGDDNAMGVSISESHKKQGANEIFYTKDEKPTDFNIKVKVVVEIGAEFYANNNITDVTFEFKDSWAEGETKPNGYQEASDVTTKRNVTVTKPTKTHAADDYTYIDIDTEATTLTIPTLSDDHTSITGTNPDKFVLGSGSSTTKSKVFTIEALDLKVFKWGTFFNHKTPCEYYNGLYQAGTITSQADDVDLVYAEMNAMKADLQPSEASTNIYLTATLNTTLKEHN
ncbi:MAG: hypothetical protein SOX92_04540 [Candidatus Onthovivens sp.]|nr:hypothetical protein [Candidatus Onthovivens sp.]